MIKLKPRNRPLKKKRKLLYKFGKKTGSIRL